MPPSNSELTVGIDIGTSSVKAVAADADGNVVARVAHPARLLRAEPAALRARRRGRVARTGRAARSPRSATSTPRGVSVAAMVPVADRGRRRRRPVRARPALRRRTRPPGPASAPARRGRRARAVPALARRATARRARLLDGAGRREPRAHGPAGDLDDRRGSTDAAVRLDGGWDAALLAACGARVEQMPELGISGQPLGEVTGHAGCVLEGGTIDAMAEQIVAGADDVGDVLVILGTTLIVWAVVPDLVRRLAVLLACRTPRPAGSGLSAVRATRAACSSTGRRACSAGDGRRRRALTPRNVPIWVPYPRGERVPLQRRRRAAPSSSISISRTARAAIRRAAFEASGFVTRRMIDARAGSGPPHRRDRRRDARRRAGSRRSPTAPGSRCTSARFPKAARSAPRSSPGSPPDSRPTWPTRRAGRARNASSSPTRRGSSTTNERYARFSVIAR